MSALAAGLRGERVIARKATLGGIDTLSALSPSFSRQAVILRKTAFFVRYAFTALSRDRKLFFSVHGGKASGCSRRFLGHFRRKCHRFLSRIDNPRHGTFGRDIGFKCPNLPWTAP